MVAGIVTGAFRGWLIGLKVGDADPFFRFEIEVTGAAVCGLAGYIFGERFVDLAWKFLEHAPDAGSGIDID